MKSDLIYRRKKRRKPAKRRAPIRPIMDDDNEDWMIGTLSTEEIEIK